MTRPYDGAVAIVGMAFRMPGDHHDATIFWQALKDQVDLVTTIPSDRWAVDELQHAKRAEAGRSITYAAGVLSDIDRFDAGFFGISPREAAWLDPQQRLLLELSWEAFENAGLKPSALKGSDCAVYVGIAGLDYGVRGMDDLASLSAHTMTGNTLSIAANRLSYFYDLHGPSLAVDTACSSSLVAVHHACRAIQTGEASTALVGGVNLLLHPYPFIGFTKASMLSAKGRCRPFDAAGDGYVRAEGGAMLLLKPYAQAVEDGDAIQAVILASGVNADGGRKTGITIPSPEGQTELMRDVLSRSGLSPDQVDFIEAHGTGTVVGDPIEAAAIGEVYGQGRTNPLPISSVKANLGHMEAASGMAGLVKAVLALQNQALPAALHLQQPNPHIDFQALNLSLVTEYQALSPPPDRPLAAGVNSFGFGGANAHLLLQAHSPPDPVPQADQPAESVALPPLFLSARTDDALHALAGRYAVLLDGQSAEVYADIARAAVVQRDALTKRLVLRPESVADAVARLRRHAQGESCPGILCEEALPQHGPVAFVYSGNGSQWLGMGRALLAESPQFAACMAELDAAMRPLAGFSLLQELQAAEPDSLLDDTTVAQPLLFALQVAVTRLLQEQGVTPAAVTGHSVGEVAAAWACGALDLPQAIRVICARSQAQGLTQGMGRMAAVGLSVEELTKTLQELGDDLDIEIAGINSPNQLTLSGGLDSLKQLQALMDRRGVFFRLLDLDYAFHSHYMEGIQASLIKNLLTLQPARPHRATFVSTVSGTVIDDDSLGANYWWMNIRRPVQFAQATQTLLDLGCRVLIEIGPHAILQRYLNDNLKAHDVQGRVLATQRRHDDGLQRIMDTAWRAHALADAADLQGFFPSAGTSVRLPTYPWQKERHWHPHTSENLHAISRHRVHPLLGWPLTDADLAWENVIDAYTVPWLNDHRVGGAVVYPGAAYAEMALAAAHEWLGGDRGVVEQLDILAPLVFDGDHARSLRFVLIPRDGHFQIKSRQRLSQDEWTLHAVGRLLQPSERLPVAQIPPLADSGRTVSHHEHYRLTAQLGLDYGPVFQGVQSVQVDGQYAQVNLRLPDGVHADAYRLHPGLLDLCFQTLVDFFSEAIAAGRGIALLPVKVGRLDRCRPGMPVRLRARLQRHSLRSALVDFELLDQNDQLLARVDGCRFRAAHLQGSAKQAIAHWRITPALRPHPQEGRHTQTPDIAALIEQAGIRLNGHQAERQAWFKETLPLSEALILSFAFEACRDLAQTTSFDWRGIHTDQHTTPFVRWLLGLMHQEGLFDEQAEGWTLSAQDVPPAATLWQTLLRDTPDYLPHLVLMGRVQAHLPGLLQGTVDPQALATELRASPVGEALYDNDPAYCGLRRVLEGLLQDLADQWPAARRLRVLELATGPSELPETLLRVLPADRLDYVLALSDEALQARQTAEYDSHDAIQVAYFDAADFNLIAERPLPSNFDVVIFRHSLHHIAQAAVALTHARQRLAPGGLLLVAERYPDWSACFIEGVDAAWWMDPSQPMPVTSLLPPASWLPLLAQAGFTDGQTLLEPAADGLEEGAYLLLAKSAEAEAEAEAVSDHSSAAASWVLLGDAASESCIRALSAALESRGHAVQSADRLADISRWPVDHIVHLRGWDDQPDQAAQGIGRLLADVQDLAAQPEPAPRLWVLTQGGALSGGLPTTYPARPAQSALWGFGRVLMNEYPQFSCTLLDLDAGAAHDALIFRVMHELLSPDGCKEILLSAQGRYALEMDKYAADAPLSDDAQTARVRLDFPVPGRLRNLVWLPDAPQPLGAHEVEVQTQATGLNFRDVMYLMGLLPDEAVENGFAGASLGLEFSGIVRRVGTQVQDLQPGDAVMGFGASCFASHVVTPATALARMPAGWTFEAAATVPTVFFTVYYALSRLADVQPGERVLIHGAAGGVGIAAIQLARHLGAEVFATAGSDEKRSFVQLLGADHVFDSRSLSFVEDVWAATAGEGVDVVLNSLAGEAMRRSLDVLQPFGRFLELGKRDFFENTPIGLRPFRNNVSYFGIDADQLLTGRPQLATRLFSEVMDLFHEQVLTPLPYRSFPADRVVDAFRMMQQARHIGKIVVSMADALPVPTQPAEPPAAVQLSADGAWLVTGGLSGFGLESARWLTKRGVRHVLLVSRRGPQAPGAQALIDAFAAQGVKAQAYACDIADAQAVTALIAHARQTMPPLTGVLHAAAVYDDQLMAHLNADSVDAVMRTKLLGAWHLHQATLDCPIEHFVLYSSVTTAIGNPGQANYVAANAGLEGLAALRRHQGLPASCVAWGPIGDAGYLVRNEAVKNSLAQRLGRAPLSAGQALNELDRVLQSPDAQFIPADFDWNALAKLLPSADGNRFDHLNRHRQTGAAGDALDILAIIRDQSLDDAMRIVQDLVAQEVAQTLSISPDRIERHRTLHDLGMDSLMAVELALGLEQRLGVRLPVMLLNDSPTVANVASRLIEKLQGDTTNADENQVVAQVAETMRQHGEGMSREDLHALEADALKLAQTGTQLIP